MRMNEARTVKARAEGWWRRNLDKVGLGGSLFAALLGLYLGVLHHGSWLAFGIGAVSALGTFVFIFVSFNRALAGAGIAGMAMASLLNVWIRMRKASD